jgi:hypothetical protein
MQCPIKAPQQDHIRARAIPRALRPPAPAAARPAQASQPARGSAAERDRLPEELFFALVLMERDAERARYGPTSQRALEELVKLLAERDLETLRHTWRTLFSRIVEPAEDTRRAAELVGEHFRTS